VQKRRKPLRTKENSLRIELKMVELAEKVCVEDRA
jgi:hypothetical protein